MDHEMKSANDTKAADDSHEEIVLAEIEKIKADLAKEDKNPKGKNPSEFASMEYSAHDAAR
jgi:hypothetical protein